MAAASAMCRVVLMVIGVVLAGELCGCAAGGGAVAVADGFSVEFIHRDSARSPYRDPALTAHGRMLAAARRSAARANGSVAAAAAPPSAGGADDVVSKVISRSFEYLMAVNVGTPPRQMLAIADTGSDLVWVGCNNATATAAAGDETPPVRFDPAGSLTFGRVSCQSDACQELSDASCDADSNCQYRYAYGDGSRTSGLLSTETFTFHGAGDGGSRHLRVASVSFGCSTVMAGTFLGDGLVGLGGGALSLVAQLGAATSLGRRFSYCLAPHDANTSSLLNFGARAVVSEPGAAATPLVRSEVETYYTVAIDAVKVGGKEVAVAAAASGSTIIVDSGTTLTFLDPALLAPAVEELSRLIKLPRAESPESLLKLCYDVSKVAAGRRGWDQLGIPDVTLVLGGGAAVTLPAANAFVLVEEGTLCLAVVAMSKAQPVSILGNIAQQNFHVGYDLDARTVTFAAADCTRPSSSSSSSA